jgi:hypothetical protein
LDAAGALTFYATVVGVVVSMCHDHVAKGKPPLEPKRLNPFGHELEELFVILIDVLCVLHEPPSLAI